LLQLYSGCRGLFQSTESLSSTTVFFLDARVGRDPVDLPRIAAVWAFGIYLDDFVKTPAGWRLSHREADSRLPLPAEFLP
jgi:hypothetical protein